jgi:hypothetical protein
LLVWNRLLIFAFVKSTKIMEKELQASKLFEAIGVEWDSARKTHANMGLSGNLQKDAGIDQETARLYLAEYAKPHSRRAASINEKASQFLEDMELLFNSKSYSKGNGIGESNSKSNSKSKAIPIPNPIPNPSMELESLKSKSNSLFQRVSELEKELETRNRELKESYSKSKATELDLRANLEKQFQARLESTTGTTSKVYEDRLNELKTTIATLKSDHEYELRQANQATENYKRKLDQDFDMELEKEKERLQKSDLIASNSRWEIWKRLSTDKLFYVALLSQVLGVIGFTSLFGIFGLFMGLIAFIVFLDSVETQANTLMGDSSFTARFMMFAVEGSFLVFSHQPFIQKYTKDNELPTVGGTSFEFHGWVLAIVISIFSFYSIYQIYLKNKDKANV